MSHMITVPRPRWHIWRSHVALITWQARGWVRKSRVCSISISHVIAYKWVMPYTNTHKWVMLEACHVWLHIVESHHKWSLSQIWIRECGRRGWVCTWCTGCVTTMNACAAGAFFWIWTLWCIWSSHVAQIMLQARLSGQVQSERDNAMAQVAHLQSQVCAMTNWCVCHDAFTTVPWLICECVMPQHNWLVCNHNCLCVMTHGCACP